MEAYPFTPTPIFEGGREEHEVKIFKSINFRKLRGLRVLRGENALSSSRHELSLFTF